MGKDLKGRELGVGIYQRKDKAYCARFTDRFGVRRSMNNKNLTTLREMLNIAMYEDKVLKKSTAHDYTVDEWYQQWISLYKEGVIKPQVVFQYKEKYQKYIKPELGDIKLSNINAVMIRKFIKPYELAGKKGNIEFFRKILHDMFERAIENEIMTGKNPAKAIKIPKMETYKQKSLLIREEEMFLNYSKGRQYYYAYITQLNTGLRFGEMAALRDEDIDLKNRKIYVRHTLIYTRKEGRDDYIYRLGSPKTKSSNRVVLMNDDCKAAIKAQMKIREVWRKKYFEEVDNDELLTLIFTTRTGKPIKNSSYNYSLKRIVNNIRSSEDSDFRSISSHDLRHTFATRCFEANMSPKVVQALMGHESLKMTMDLYTHVTSDIESAELEKLNNLGNGTKLVQNAF